MKGLCEANKVFEKEREREKERESKRDEKTKKRDFLYMYAYNIIQSRDMEKKKNGIFFASKK